MSAAEALEDLTPVEWAAWVRAQAAPCCPDWPHITGPHTAAMLADGWVPIPAGWHVPLWVHPDHPHRAIPGRRP